MKQKPSTYTLYRVCIWLPILVPAFVILSFRALGLSLANFIVPEILLYSLVYGGLPYAALAAWATWWVGGRSEHEIQRLMYRAPIVMALLFAAVALVAGLATGALLPFVAVAVLGAAVTLSLGYVYVGVAVLLRHLLGPAPH